MSASGQKICRNGLIPFTDAFKLRKSSVSEDAMGFAKGSISLSPTKDVPLLLQVLHSQFITHDQLRDFMSLGSHELNGHSFNWRVHRLVENRFLDRHCVPGVSGNIYSLGSISKPIL